MRSVVLCGWVALGLACVDGGSGEGGAVPDERVLDGAVDARWDDAALDGSTDGEIAPALDAEAVDSGRADAAADLGMDDAEAPDAARTPVTCRFAGQPYGPLEVNTWRGDVEQVEFVVAGLPDPTQITSATLEFLTHDADHPDAEGWIEVNDTDRLPLPADPALDNQDRRVSIDVAGRLIAGENRVRFIAFDGPDGAFYRIADVQLIVDGVGIGCPEAPPVVVVAHPAPAGISAFAALAPDFPRAETLSILAGLERPFTTVLLDFGPVLDAAGLQMFEPGAIGARAPNPEHLRALGAFVRAFVDATPVAASRHLQLYLVNGPGVRRPADYPRAYPLGPADLDRRLREDAATRAELAAYVAALDASIAPFRDRVAVRLVVGLEDNYTQATARSLVELVRAAGWSGAVGRNPCGCGFGDTERAGDFHEEHPHSVAAVDAAVGRLQAPDAFSNDGWGWTIAQGGVLVDEAAVVAMARAASRSGVWFHLWYDPLQGYPIPADGARRLRFDHAPAQVRDWLQRGLAQ